MSVVPIVPSFACLHRFMRYFNHQRGVKLKVLKVHPLVWDALFAKASEWIFYSRTDPVSVGPGCTRQFLYRGVQIRERLNRIG